jgi:hypothetical protein
MKSSLGYNAVHSVEIQQTFRKKCQLHLRSRRVIQKRNQRETESKQTLKIETCFPETSVEFQQTTRRYIPEDITHKHSCENVKS